MIARLTRAVVRAGTATLLLLVVTVPVLAQTRPAPPRPPQRPIGPTPRAGSWEVAGGGVFLPGFDLGDATADLTRNSTTASELQQFRTSSELGAAPAVQGRLAFYFSPRLAIEGGVRYARPVLGIQITGDDEGAPDETAEETLNQWLFDGSVLWHFPRSPASRSRVVPFVMGGAGYFRELHEGQELVETGLEYHGGGGVKIWFGNPTARRRFGVRAEGGVSIRDGAFDFEEDKIRVSPIVAGSIVYLF